ncbi:hypothetical protein COW36_04200 [bacterium (Candidatus Blackallbacteria) CG17_big_fil_post_rev_8_21_14_2_50_48_46]|uniref:Polymerase/histidinol phosphatase N-terminal domain-containing protein n=1 Tax=bacterium (Candidatus Blackallbacteria) CG17_big_fil_post_rev_8_21_14_2_50_48_46 TaxID=2014261 RepID=A0A2M7G8R7_9BACT|nr:MAG: hypothetical protein COW64_04745 [bacterium (Candidatus Blackallbacteria) CG18_big_fil_WC_8_21_14_2_50_49_26]PIW18500.1 MAG: hypothetical protein COW36_04200 [bacterium (Candidatus Blackallbacteria) CG17_big_fil_post_rev_8_21_14_2_50_48_46]PIW46515.1 MAG: hypothetical protein COW20_16480 [bacterium (Candidatus Blackallbacteria) CG13_big_fil_rev_8_21_14_2_50_49_14]
MTFSPRLLTLASLVLLSACSAALKPISLQPLNRQSSNLTRFSANRTPAKAMRAYFGNLHSHTSYSDGILNPREAYRMAIGNGLDFMAVTEHNHEAAGGSDGIYLTPQLYEDLKKNAREFTTPGKFAALYGQEFSTISSGNHMNIFNAANIVDVGNGDFKTLFEKYLPAHPEIAFVQFNHPNFKRDLGLAENTPQPQIFKTDQQGHQQMEARLLPIGMMRSNLFNDYGYDDYNRDFQALAKAANPWVRSIEILNGPGTNPKPIAKAEAYMEEDYFFYLNQGFKLGPTADQDNHYAHWGSLHPGRSGVLASELTPEGIYEGLRARRIFATEDKNMAVYFTANGHWMGEDLPAAGEVQLEIQIEDKDEPQAQYLLQIFTDTPGQNTAKPIVQQTLNPGQKQFQFVWRPEVGQENYAFVKITQTNADGSFDDAWTAPVWIKP